MGAASYAYVLEQHCKQRINQNHDRDGGHHRCRCALPQAFGVRLDAQTLVAADQRNQHTKHHRLGGGQRQVGDLNGSRQCVDEK